MGISKRILSLDIGTKRIGLAISDALLIGATPLKTIERKNDTFAREEIIKVLDEYMTDVILIGIPYNMDGSLGFQAKNCLDFVKPFREKYQILEQDERLSSFESEEILKQKGKKYTKNKGLVDKVAAALILQNYLDNLK